MIDIIYKNNKHHTKYKLSWKIFFVIRKILLFISWKRLEWYGTVRLIGFWSTFVMYYYRQISDISRTKCQNLNVFHLALQLSLPYPLELPLPNPLEPVKNGYVVGAASTGCPDYVWVINNYIAYQGATFINSSARCFWTLGLTEIGNFSSCDRTSDVIT